MRYLGYFIASFLIVVIFVGLMYAGIFFGPMLQTSVLLPSSPTYFSFQVEHEDSFRVNTPHEITVFIQETPEKVIRAGYIDVQFEPGTTFLKAESIKESTLSVINTTIEQGKGYARVEVVSSESFMEPKFRGAFKATIQVDHVPASDAVILEIEGLFANDAIPPISNQIPSTHVIIPVMHDATMQYRGGAVLAKHIFGIPKTGMGESVDGRVLLQVPQGAEDVEITLLYEPQYLKISNIILNEQLIASDTLIDKKNGVITLRAQAGAFPVGVLETFATLSYEALRSTERTGISIAKVHFAPEDVNIETEEKNDPENNLGIAGGVFELPVSSLKTETSINEEREEEVKKVNAKDLSYSCELKDLKDIVDNKELGARQAQDIINDICFVAEKGIIKGYEDGTFRPNASMNRAEYAKVATLLVWDENAITRAVADYVSGKKNYAFVYHDFSSEEQWFYRYVLAAKMIGIFKGYADGNFWATNFMNRAEVAKVTSEAMALNSPNVSMAIARNMSAGDSWYQPYMAAIKEMLGGDVLVSVLPADGEVKRYEVAQLIAKYLRFIEP